MKERIELFVPWFYRCDFGDYGIDIECHGIDKSGKIVTLSDSCAHFSPGEFELGEKDERKMKLDRTAYNREIKRLKRINKLDHETAIEADALKWFTPRPLTI